MKLLLENRGASLLIKSEFITGKGSLDLVTHLMDRFNLWA